MQELQKPIFIVGCPRSGTTILASLLNNHSQIASATEMHFFNYISKQKKYNWGKLDKQSLTMLLDESRIIDFCTHGNLDKNTLLDALLAAPSTDKKTIFTILANNFIASKNKFRFCEKTPQHLLNVEEILNIFPDAKIIYLVRDGRDTVNSLMKMPWRPQGLLNNSRFWKQYVTIGTRLQNKYSSQPQSFKTIKYEDLLTLPKQTLKEICQFIELPYEESLSKQNENVFSEWEASWKHKASEELDSTRIGAWQKELSDQDQILINWHLSKSLKALGYDVKQVKLAFGDSLRLGIEYSSLSFNKVVRSFADVIN
ncbi:MAG: sulfotransferase [Candidatus Caenarcaniphilales bacterium]|jgi:hypothetical protein|nr:sulfotransferase [Candidatus Caenarcaniphilales bacterium]